MGQVFSIISSFLLNKKTNIKASAAKMIKDLWCFLCIITKIKYYKKNLDKQK